MLELLASDYRPLIQDVLAFSICFAAFIWGAWPERAMAAVWFVVLELSLWMHSIAWGSTFQFTDTDLFLASTDICAGILWILVALNANRNYPMVIAALQVLVVAAHLVRGLVDAISPISYAVMVTAPGWLQLIVLAIGLGRHVGRNRRYGPYREWRVALPWQRNTLALSKKA